MAKSIAVTGGAGFIGRHLVQALCAEGHHVVVIDRQSETFSADGKSEYRSADLSVSSSIAKVLRGIGLLFHLAGSADGSLSVRYPRRDFEANCVSTFNVLEAAALAGIERVVYVSSASVYGRPSAFPVGENHSTLPIIPYAASKLSGEHIGMAWWHSHGLPFVVARPFCVYGPGESPDRALVEVSRYVRWHLNNLPVQIVGDGMHKTRDFIHVSDLVAGLILVANRGTPGAIYNIGTGVETSMSDLVQLIQKATRRTVQTRELPHITDDTYRLVADISKIRALGYKSRVALDEGVALVVMELGPRPRLPTNDTIFRIDQQSELTNTPLQNT